jgi:hypothetical protein
LKLLANQELTHFKLSLKDQSLVQMLGFAEFIQIQNMVLKPTFLVTGILATVTNQADHGKILTLTKMDIATEDLTHLLTTGGFEITGTALTLDVSNAVVLTL